MICQCGTCGALCQHTTQDGGPGSEYERITCMACGWQVVRAKAGYAPLVAPGAIDRAWLWWLPVAAAALLALGAVVWRLCK
jgi:hypothetical protein